MKEGYCYSLPSWNSTTLDGYRCKSYGVDKGIHVRGEWRFEQDGSKWLDLNRTKVSQAHARRKANRGVDHIWDKSEVEKIFGFKNYQPEKN